jgi:2-phosphosulfolactate phosphatase
LVALAPAGGAGRGDDVPGRGLSPEAGAAVGAYRAVAGRVGAALRACGSGLELREMGFGGDVEVAGKVGVSDVVPVLVDGWFVDGGKDRRAG